MGKGLAFLMAFEGHTWNAKLLVCSRPLVRDDIGRKGWLS